MREIADNKSRDLPLDAAANFITRFGSVFFLLFQTRRGYEGRRLLRLVIGRRAARPGVDEGLPIGTFLGALGFALCTGSVR